FRKLEHAALNLFVYKKMTLRAWYRSYESKLLDFVFPFCVHKFSPGLWRKLLKTPEVIYLVTCYASPLDGQETAIMWRTPFGRMPCSGFYGIGAEYECC